jgi:hypothetical protein
MLNLANNATGNVYAIPLADWTAINIRVGTVLALTQLLGEGAVTSMLPHYPALLGSSQVWQQTTFVGLITQSQALNSYAAKAITNFGTLNTTVKEVMQHTSTVPDSLKQMTTDALHQLAKDTTPLAAAFNGLFTQMLTFLTNNQVVDVEAAKYKDQLGNFWAPVGDSIKALEDAAGLVTGNWKAITDDLNNVLASPIDVTMPFIESLNIDAALVSWQSVQAEAGAFAGIVSGQEEYWKVNTGFNLRSGNA